jgi:membrane protease YdiL (CAAX protease family)
MKESSTGKRHLAVPAGENGGVGSPSLGLSLVFAAVAQTMIFQIAIVSSDSRLFPYFQYASVTFIYIILTALILLEIRNLHDFRLDAASVAVFVASTILRRRLGINGEAFFLVITAACGVVTLLAFARYRPRLAPVSLSWVAGGVLVGLLLLVPLSAEAWLTGVLNLRLVSAGPQAIEPQHGVSFLAVVREAIYQLSFGVPTEELLFRGFLWGYLERRGWAASRAGWVQAILFWLLHWPNFVVPLGFLISISFITFAVTALTLRSKRILPAILAHGIVNTLS